VVANQQLGQILSRSGNPLAGPSGEGSMESIQSSQQIAPTLSIQNTVSKQNTLRSLVSVTSNC